MTREQPAKPIARRRGKPIEVWVNDNEKKLITTRAAEVGLSRSAYLRPLGLNTPVRSVVDLRAITDLAKVNGDFGRVAGLLKLWTGTKFGGGVKSADVANAMLEFRRLQVEVGKIMGLVLKAK